MNRSLSSVVDRNLGSLPRVRLARFPTPLEDAPRLAQTLGVARLLVKRDDLTDLALGGNKVRKLEFLLGDALAQRADTVITTAGVQSNFLRLTAAAARRLGLRSILVVRGRPGEPVRGNLLLMQLFGAEIRFVETDDPYSETTIAAMQALAEDVRKHGGHPYVMHLGTFSGGRAAVGYVPAALELLRQLEDRSLRSQHLVLAVGSGGTQAGLLLGLRLVGEDCRVLGASVNTPADELRSRIGEHIRAAADLLGVKPPVCADEVHITDAHIGPGYGIPTPDSIEAVRLAASAEGLVFDPVYTGKAWAALAHAVRTGDISPKSTVIFLHTGGAPNLFVHAESIASGIPGMSNQTRFD